MRKQNGFILKELVLYLFFGSLLLITVLRLFLSSWQIFSSLRRVNEVSNDFINVSERIKYDLLSEIQKITIGKTSFTFTFLQFEPDNKTYSVKEYTLMMSGSRLIYNIYGNNSYTAIYLSSLVKNISFETQGDLFMIRFDYGDFAFRRYFRLDHIKTKRVLYSFISDSPDLSVHCRASTFLYSESESDRKLHLLL